MNISRIGIDLAKNVFQLHGVDRHGKVVWKRRLKRDQWLKAVLDRGQPGCEIGMEACGSSHHWARELQSRGYPVKLIAPQFVKPYVKSNKNDANDAEAICEAMSRPNMRFVTVKSIDQQDIQATHRIRSGLMTQRTAKANQIRGLVAEHGLVAPQHLSALRATIPCWLEDVENGLTDHFRCLLHGLWRDLTALDDRVLELDQAINRLANNNEVTRRLQQLRGVGHLCSNILVKPCKKLDGLPQGVKQPFSYFPKRQQMLGSLALAMSKIPATNVRGVVHQIDALMMNRSICVRSKGGATAVQIPGTLSLTGDDKELVVLLRVCGSGSGFAAGAEPTPLVGQ